MSDRPYILSVNRNVPPVQAPVADLGSLLTTVNSLKQGVENLGGYRGSLTGRAVTFNDLVGLGLVTPITLNTSSGTVTSGVATNAALKAELQVPVGPFAALSTTPTVGQEAVITDATVNTWGALITVGGGALTVRVWWNGTNWTVLGQ